MNLRVLVRMNRGEKATEGILRSGKDAGHHEEAWTLTQALFFEAQQGEQKSTAELASKIH